MITFKFELDCYNVVLLPACIISLNEGESSMKKKFNQHEIMRYFNSDFMHINISKKNWIILEVGDWRPLSIILPSCCVSTFCCINLSIDNFKFMLSFWINWKLACGGPIFAYTRVSSRERLGSLNSRWNSNFFFVKETFDFYFSFPDTFFDRHHLKAACV